jgi:hypothetical protein
MLIELTTNKQTINKIMKNSLVIQMINGCLESGTSPLVEEQYLKITLENRCIGLIRFKELTKVCIEAHIQILPEAHKKGNGKQAVLSGILWFKNNTKYKTLITYVPENCPHVLKFMYDNAFDCAGAINNGINYAGRLVKLFLFQVEIK